MLQSTNQWTAKPNTKINSTSLMCRCSVNTHLHFVSYACFQVSLFDFYFLIASVCLDLNCLSPQLKPSLQRGGSSASLHNSTMRNTIFQLMIHTLDPLGDGQYTRNVMMSLKCPRWSVILAGPLWHPRGLVAISAFFFVHTGVSKRSKRWALSFLGSSFTAYPSTTTWKHW